MLSGNPMTESTMRIPCCTTVWPGPAACRTVPSGCCTPCGRRAPLTQTQLSEQLSLPKQTVNSALKKLVEEGVLRLEAADGNLKNKRVCLTEAGEAFLRRTVDRVFGVESAAAARLTEEERSALVALSQKLLDAFRAETEAFLQTAAIGD